MLLRHGIGAVGPEIDEPELGGLCESSAGSAGLDNNVVPVHPADCSIAVDMESPAQAAPLPHQLGKSVVNRIAHHPAHIVLLDVTPLASAAQNHQE